MANNGGTLIDPLPALLAELIADTALAAAVSTSAYNGDSSPSGAATTAPRVYAEQTPIDPYKHPVYAVLAPQIAIVGLAGLAAEMGIYSAPRFELRAYDHSPVLARTLCYMALNVLNERHIKRGAVNCYVSFAADMGGTLPTPNYDPDTRTPFYYAFFGATVYGANRS